MLADACVIDADGADELDALASVVEFGGEGGEAVRAHEDGDEVVEAHAVFEREAARGAPGVLEEPFNCVLAEAEDDTVGGFGVGIEDAEGGVGVSVAGVDGVGGDGLEVERARIGSVVQ
ncbi:MAG: hypothetical protein IPJ98_28460 [Bryobacterales bacterium]|nr:hypothetical protein [Bryobacterales bacterium]